MCGRKFSIKTVCMAAKQMVRSISNGVSTTVNTGPVSPHSSAVFKLSTRKTSSTVISSLTIFSLESLEPRERTVGSLFRFLR